MFYYFKFQCFTNLFQMSHKMYFFVNNVKCQWSIFILTSMYQSRCLTLKKTHHTFLSTSIIELYYSTQIYCEMYDNKNNYDDMTEYLNLLLAEKYFCECSRNVADWNQMFHQTHCSAIMHFCWIWLWVLCWRRIH